MSVDHKPEQANCFTEGCTLKAKWNGLCPSCYGQAKKIMESDKLEWSDLEEMGMIPIKPKKPFTELYLQKKAARSSNNGSNMGQQV